MSEHIGTKVRKLLTKDGVCMDVHLQEQFDWYFT